MSDVTPIFEARLIAIGYCEDPDGEKAVAWDSETGRVWRRVLEATPGGFLFDDVSTNGATGGVLIVGTNHDKPLLWTGDVWDGFESVELPTTSGAAWVRAVAWDGYRYLAVGEEYPVGTDPKAAAWLNVDGAGWQLIDVPAGATTFRDVAGDETNDGSSFVVIGATRSEGTEDAGWRLSEDGTWSTQSVVLDPHLEGASLDVLLDPQTAVGSDQLWVLEDEEWNGTVIGTQIYAQTGVRLTDGILVTGGQNIHDSLPLVVVASGDGRGWTPVDDLASSPKARIDGLTTFTYGVVGVGDAVYAGPDNIADYQ